MLIKTSSLKATLFLVMSTQIQQSVVLKTGCPNCMCMPLPDVTNSVQTTSFNIKGMSL